MEGNILYRGSLSKKKWNEQMNKRKARGGHILKYSQIWAEQSEKASS